MRTLRCGECGCSITAERHTKNSGLVFVYGRCTKKRQNGVKCSQPYVNADELEKQTLAFIKSLEISPLLVEWVRDELRLRNERGFEFEKVQKVKQTKKLQILLDQKKQLYGMKIDGLVSKEDYKKEKKKLLNLEQQIKGYLQTDNTFHWEKTLEDILDFATNAAAIFKKADPEARRKILRILGSNLLLKHKKVLIKGQIAFLILKKADKVINEEISRLEPQKSPILQPNLPNSASKFHLERGTRIELASSPWQGNVLPLY